MIDATGSSLHLLVAVLLLAAVVVLAFVAVIDLVAEANKRPNLAEAATAATLGLACLGFVLLFARWASLPWAIAPISLALAAAARLRRDRALLLPRLEPRSAALLTAVVIVVFLLPCVIGAAIMSAGDYPQVFFNADTPYRLTHAFQLMEDRGFPPLSLSNLGVRQGYHYAAPATAAATALVTGLPPHTSFFLVLTLAAIGTVGVTALLATMLRGQIPFPLAFSLILVTGPTTAWNLAKSPHDWFSDPQLFSNHFPDITVYFGVFLFLVALYASLDLRSLRRAILAVLAVTLLAATKTGYYPTAGLVVVSGALVCCYRTRDLRWMLLPAAALAAGLMVTQATGSSTNEHLQLNVYDPFFLFKHFSKRALKYGLDLLLFIVPAVAYAWAVGRAEAASRAHSDRLLIVGLTIVGLLVYLNIFGSFVVQPDGSREANHRILDPLNLSAKLVVIAGIVVLSQHWASAHLKQNLFVSLFFGLVVALPLLHRGTHALNQLFDPRSAHEYVDNRAIAEALTSIPLDNSIIVTNDLRYPADGFKRDQRQMQIPALFGHQAYAANTAYELYADSARRTELQARLAGPDWDPDIAQIASDQGWTHLLVHKPWPSPQPLPLRKLFENDAYSVYAFE